MRPQIGWLDCLVGWAALLVLGPVLVVLVLLVALLRVLDGGSARR